MVLASTLSEEDVHVGVDLDDEGTTCELLLGGDFPIDRGFDDGVFAVLVDDFECVLFALL